MVKSYFLKLFFHYYTPLQILTYLDYVLMDFKSFWLHVRFSFSKYGSCQSKMPHLSEII